LVPVYWALAFLVASAIPNLADLSAFLAALCIVQFSYSFPPLLMIGAMVQRDAAQEGEGYDPLTRQNVRKDAGWKRWVRGYMKHFFLNTGNLIFCLGSFVVAGLGIYSSVVAIRAKFATGAHSSFSCKL
jgi:hypothetical protein